MTTLETRERHEVTTQLGMWTFLATEVLLFGGLLAAYTLFRCNYPQAFAEGARHMELILGTINTAVLLLSSVFVAIADRAVRAGRRGMAVGCLAAAAALGMAFLAIKGAEYHAKFVERLVPGRHFGPGLQSGPPIQLFFFLYFAATGLHAAHLFLGVGALVWIGWRVWRRGVGPDCPEPAATVGLYWHFVDGVWVFLYPLFYLAGR